MRAREFFKKLPWMGWVSGLMILFFVLSAVFAPWISANAPGNVHELREVSSQLLSLTAKPGTSEALQQNARKLRLLLLSLSINFDESKQEEENQLLTVGQTLRSLETTDEDLRRSIDRLNDLIEGRRDHFFPLFSVGPDMPSPDQQSILTPPTSRHPFGTDQSGRDVFSRLIHGVKNALFFSVAVVIACLILGTLIGGFMGFYGGWIDLGLSRVMEIIGNFPIFLLQLTFLAYVEPSYGILFFVMCFSGWIPYCRFVRAEFLKLREQEFAQAATVIGASKTRIFFKHLLPNSLTPVITYIPFDLSSTIISLGALSFIGFGEPIDVPSVGELLRQAQRVFQTAWWLALFPGLALFFLTLSLALFGSAVRDVLDPRFKVKRA